MKNGGEITGGLVIRSTLETIIGKQTLCVRTTCIAAIIVGTNEIVLEFSFYLSGYVGGSSHKIPIKRGTQRVVK